MITAFRDGRRVDHYGHPITETEAATVTKVLAAEGIRIQFEWDINGVLHLWATKPMKTVDEFRAIRAFRAVGDQPLAFHQAVTHG